MKKKVKQTETCGKKLRIIRHLTIHAIIKTLLNALKYVLKQSKNMFCL